MGILELKIKYMKLRAHIIFPALALGLAPFIMFATESILVLAYNSSLLKYGGDMAVGMMTILSTLMQFLMLPVQGLAQGAQPIISYTPVPELTELTVWGIRIYFSAGVLIGIQMASLQTLMALGKAGTSTFLSLLRKVILLIPFIYIFPLFMENKVFAIIFAEPVADVISVITTIMVFSIQFRKTLRDMELLHRAEHISLKQLQISSNDLLAPEPFCIGI